MSVHDNSLLLLRDGLDVGPNLEGISRLVFSAGCEEKKLLVLLTITLSKAKYILQVESACLV